MLAQEPAAGEPLVLVGGPRAIYVCSVAPEGRLSILQTVARPPDAPQGCLPYMSWHLKPQKPAAQGACRLHFVSLCFQAMCGCSNFLG